MALASVGSALDESAFMRDPAPDVKRATNVQITHRATAVTTTTSASTATTTATATTLTSHSPISAASIAPALRNKMGAPMLKPKSSATDVTSPTKPSIVPLSSGRPMHGAPKSPAKPTLMAIFRERYEAATACKMYDVEELIDYYVHRRLAAITAVIISALPIVITPNQITLFGLVFGWGAAACVYDSQFRTPFGWDPRLDLGLGAMLMFCWIVSDCADGQVARLCKRGTRTGRFFDGLIDLFVMAVNCLVLGWVVADRFGREYMVLATIAGFSLWIHCITYDKIKNKYMENTLPQSESDGETVESVMAEFKESKEKTSWSLETILFGIYVVYLAGQAILTSDVQAIKKDLHAAKPNDEQARRAYQQKYAHVIRLASWMGLSAHVTGMYIGFFFAMFDFAALYYLMLYYAVVLNAVFVVTWVAYLKSNMSTATAASMAAP